jgi:hypothetical protein
LPGSNADVNDLSPLRTAPAVDRHPDLHIARLRRSVGLAIGHIGCRWTWPHEGVGAGQCVGQPVPVGHDPDQVRGAVCGHPGGRGKQRARRGSAHDRHRVGRSAELDLATPDHWDAELDVRMRTQAGSAARDLIALST